MQVLPKVRISRAWRINIHQDLQNWIMAREKTLETRAPTRLLTVYTYKSVECPEILTADLNPRPDRHLRRSEAVAVTDNPPIYVYSKLRRYGERIQHISDHSAHH